MKILLPLSGAVVLALAAGTVSPLVAGETVTEKTTTEKTTSYSGTVTQVDPSSSTIILRSESAAAPQRYTYSKKTTFVDESGNTITYEEIQNRPVTIYYTKEGGQMMVSRVVVNRPTAGVIQQRKEKTIEREEETD